MCQKCRHPLTVNSDLSLQLEAVTAFSDSPMAIGQSYHASDFKTQEKAAMTSLGDSFVVSKPTGKDTSSSYPSTPSSSQSTNLDNKVTALTQLFEIASDKSQYDHPLCTKCSDEVTAELERRLKEAESDRKAGEEAFRRLVASYPSEEGSSAKSDEKAYEQELEAKILEVRKQKIALQQELKAAEEESRNFDAFEARFWKEYQDFSLKYRSISDDHSKLKQQIKNTRSSLNRLRRTNIYDDAFHISYDGHFGTINGFRLGRLPSQPVDWSETNAGLGQVILLLTTIAKHAGFTFSKFKLNPLGSFSKIGKLDDPTQTYELYGSSDYSLGRLFWYRRFDYALISLLACIKEFGEHAAKTDSRFQQRYKIDKDQIGDVTIKIQFSKDADWTKALKYMLTNVKFLLSWCAQKPERY